MDKKYISVKLCCLAALLCLALGATAQSNIYRDNNSTSALPLVMGEKNSKVRFIPTAIVGLIDIIPTFDQSGDDADWFTFKYNEDLSNHDYLDVIITKDPGDNDRTGKIEVQTKSGASYISSYIYLMQPKARCVYAKQTNMDTSFFVAFIANSASSAVNLLLYATTNSKESNVSVYRNDNNTLVGSSVKLEQNKVKTVYTASGSHTALSSTPAYNTTYQSTNTVKSFKVQSDSAIALYAYNQASATGEISCITPTSALGDEYFIMSYRTSLYSYPEVFLVVATENNTLVTITPAADLSAVSGYKDGKANVPFTVKLAKGGTYLVKAKMSYTANERYNNHPELTGTHIKASQRVVVFGGIECGNISPQCQACDHVYEQMLPLRAWGKRYAVVNPSRPSNVYRIGAAYDNTAVTITSSSGQPVKLTLNRGKFAEYRIVTSTSPFAYIEADKPVQVGLFAESQTCLSSGVSDPFLSMVGPVDRGLFTATFTPAKVLNGTGEHYMTVVVDKRYQDSTKLRRTTGGLSGKETLTFNDMPNTAYAYATKTLIQDDNYNYTLSNAYGFTAYSYGYANAEGYGYLIGAQLGEKMEEGAALDGVIMDSYEYCLNKPSNLPACLDGSTSCSDPMKKYYWYETLTDWNNDNPLPGPPNINTSSISTHTYFVSQESGCGILYPKQVTIKVLPLPTVTFTKDGTGKDTILVCLDADENFDYGGRYMEGGLSKKDKGTYTFADGVNAGKTFKHKGAGAGLHRVTYTYKNENGCEASVTTLVNVETLDRSPRLNVANRGYASLCNSKDSKFNSLTLQVINAPNRKYQWYHNDVEIPNDTNSTHSITYGKQPYGGGKYSVYIKNDNGCKVTLDTIITMYNPPDEPKVSTYNSTAACTGSSYELYDAAYVFDVSSKDYQWYRTAIDPVNAIGDSTYRLMVENDSVPGIRRYILGAVNLIPGRSREEGCWSYGELNLEVYEEAGNATIITPSNVKEFCMGDSLKLTAIAANSHKYTWYFIDGSGARAELVTSDRRDYYAKMPGKYQVWSISAEGCKAKQESAIVTLTRHSNPIQPIIIEGASKCEGDSIKVEAMSNSGVTNISFQWYAVSSDNVTYTPLDRGNDSTYYVKKNGRYSVRATQQHSGVSCVSPYSAPTPIALLPTPRPPVISGVTDVCAGNNNVLLVAKPAQGSAAIKQYQWYENAVQMPGVSGDTCRTSQSSPGTVRYTVVASSDNCKSGESAPTAVTAWRPTASITPVGSTNVCFGSEVELTATTDADKGLVFQWYENGAPVGNSVPTYKVSSADPRSTKTGNYSFLVTDVRGCKSDMSNAITVNIFQLPDNPTVTITPAGDICAGSSITLTAPTGEASYAWFFKKEGKPVVRLTGAKNTYTVTNVSADSAGQYKVVTTNADKCESIEGVATVVVHPLPPAPLIQHPAQLSMCNGDSILLSAYTNVGGYTYKEFRWYKEDNGQKPLLPQTGSDIYVKSKGTYSVVGISSYGCVSPESDTVAVTSRANPSTPTLAPLVGDKCTNTTNTITATSSGATSWQWYSTPLGGKQEAIDKATSGTYAVKESGRYAARAYQLYSSDKLTCSSPLSAPQEVALVEAPLAPEVSGSANVCVGNNNVTLFAEPAPNSAAVTGYRWYKNGIRMNSITNDTCRDSHSTGSGAQLYKYEAEALNGVCVSVKTLKEVTVRKPEVSIAAKDGVKDTCYGHTVTLSATATGVTGGTYSWYEDGKHISGSTAAAYMVESKDPLTTKTGTYSVFVTDGYGCKSEQSNPIDVTIYKPPVDPVITPSYKAGVCAGSNITLTATASDGTYEWYFEDTLRAYTATSNVYTISDAQVSQEGRYAVVITSGSGCRSKEGWDTVVVHPKPATPKVETVAAHICAGDSVRIWAYDEGGYVYKRYEWFIQDGNGHRQLPTLSTKQIFVKAAGLYSAVGISDHGCKSAESAQVKVETHAKPDAPTISPTDDSVTVCTNGATILTAYSPNADSYQWYGCYPNDTAALSGATGSTYAVTGSGIYAARAYRLWGKGDYNLACPSDLRSKPKKTLLYPVPSPRVLEGAGGFTACAGDTVVLRAKDLANPPVPIAQYRWYKNGLLAYSTTADTCIVTEVNDAIYTVIAETDKKCYSDPSPAQKVSIRKPSIYITNNDTSVCFGNMVTLQTKTNTNPAKSKYEWHKNDKPIAGAVSSFLQVRSEGAPTVGEKATYYAYVIDELGCKSTEPSPTIGVEILALPPTPVFIKPDAVCEGEGLTLRVSPSGAGTYTWFAERSGVLDSLAVTNDTIYQIAGTKTSNAGQYRVKITDHLGCRSESGGQVMVYPLPQNPIITPHDIQNICTGDSVLLTAQTVGSADGYYHRWYFNDGVREVEYLPKGDRFYAKLAGTYSVQSVSDQGCLSNGKDKVEVVINRRPNPPVIYPEDPVISVCANDATTIRGSSSGATSYQWYAVDAGNLHPIGNATQADYAVRESGSYTVRAYIKYGELQCSALSAQAKVMEIFTIPPSPILAVSKPSGCAGDTITLTASPGPNSPTITSYKWHKKGAEMAFPTTDVHFTTSIDTAVYTVRAVSDKGCYSAVSVPKEISIRSRPTVSIDGGDREACGGRITLSTITNAISGSYEWYEDSTAVSGASTANYVVQAAKAEVGKKASYHLYVTDRYGCRSENPSNTVEVNIRALPPTPVVSVDPAKGVCVGDNATMQIKNHAGTGIYQWFKRNGRNLDTLEESSSDTYPIFDAQLSDAGQYAVEITDNYGCKSSGRGEVSLDVQGLPDVYFTKLKACEDATEFNFVSPAGGKFTGWGCTADGSKFIPADVHQGTAVVTYTYTAPNGCVSSAKEDIEIVRLPNTPILTAANLTADSVRVCPGDISVTLQTQTPAIEDDRYNTNYTYQWYRDGFALPVEVAPSYVATRVGSYYVRVCNQNLCWAADASAPVVVTQLPPPATPVIDAQSYTFCPGEFATLFVQSEERGIFQWYKGNGKKLDSIPNEITDTYLARDAGQYAVDYIGASGCRSALSNSLTITEQPLPKHPEIVPSQPNLYSGLTYNLLVKTPYSDERYEWYKSTLYANVDGPVFPIRSLSFIDTGSYMVKAINQQGCYIWSDAYTLNLSKADLFIPNIFTPNGDGINDYFQIIGLDEFVENKLEILNTREKVVFSQKNYHNTWNGEGLPNDIYYYTLELKRQDGTSTSLRGYVHLKR